MCRIWSTAFGDSVYISSPNVPRRVLIRLGRARIASQIRSAASSGEIVGNESYIFVGAIIAVRTSGMWIVVNVTLSPIVSELTTRVNASSADLDATYAEKRGGLVCTPIELTLTMWPDRFCRMCGSSPRMSLIVPR